MLNLKRGVVADLSYSGPYRRRDSKGYALSPPRDTFQPVTSHHFDPSSPYSAGHEIHYQNTTQPEAGYLYGGQPHQQQMQQSRYSQDQYEAMYAQHHQHAYQLQQRQWQISNDQQRRQFTTQAQNHHHHQTQHWPQYQAGPGDTHRAGSPTLPAPRPSQLESALTAAFAGTSVQPRWIDGQRSQDGAGTLMPHTPTVPFPLSLKRSGRGNDPFSRAVSPIKGFASEFGRGNDVAMRPQLVASKSSGNAAAGQGSSGSDVQMMSTSRPGSPSTVPATAMLEIDTSGGNVWGRSGNFSQTLPASRPFINQDHSQYASPQGQQSPFIDAPPELMASPQHDNSMANFNPKSKQQTLPQTPTRNGWSNNKDPTTIALRRVRKPSLRTLIVPGISREGSPVSTPNGHGHGPGPVSGNWSPGLAMVSVRETRDDLGSPIGVNGVKAGMSGTLSPTLFQGGAEGVEDIQWGFGIGH